VWIGSRLLLARRVEIDGRVVVQGCWLDWARIKQVLVAEAAELLPQLELEPVLEPGQVAVNRMLATLPVQLVVPPTQGPQAWTVMRTTLAIAWLCVGVIAIAGGLLLHGVLSLSERRAAFVSAVTHELRTPLTTFRLYSEMLAGGMLPEETQRQKYLETLRIEADRLARLVDNVLSYARLERGRASGHRESTTVKALLDRCLDRLVERAKQAGLALVPESELDLDQLTVVTDAAAIEQILFNLVDNAAKYASRSQDRRLHLQITRDQKQVLIRLSDHGPGVAPGIERRLFQPFSKSAEDAAHSAPGVGLGLALSRRLASELGGRLSLEKNSPEGASFLLTIPVSSHNSRAADDKLTAGH
jgi:signal transduction histidine kinase